MAKIVGTLGIRDTQGTGSTCDTRDTSSIRKIGLFRSDGIHGTSLFKSSITCSTDWFKSRTKKICSVFLASFMALSVSFCRADALGTRSVLPDGTQRISFTKDEFPQVLTFFKAERDRLEGFWPTFLDGLAPPLIGSAFLIPAAAGVFSFAERLFTGHSHVTDFIFRDANKSGMVFDLCAVAVLFLLFVHDGIPRMSRISERLDYWNVRRITEYLEGAIKNIEIIDQHELREWQKVIEFHIDETTKGDLVQKKLQ
ncbi:MAG: hypothetical protein LBK29_03315 [Oscillospiraceae bacterium]|jgi:hypothetical protein|nr:hypothetical protein [Oscillospiraceae bacterium]